MNKINRILKDNLYIADIILYSIMIFYIYQGIINYHFKCNKEEVKLVQEPQYIHINKETLYDFTIEHLKSKEGFCSKPTISPDGSLTIGYGHVILEKEHYDEISEEEATNLLMRDLNHNIKYIEDNTQLKDNKSLALGLLAFNIGSGKCLKYIKEDSLLYGDNITRILHYSNYRSLNGNVISSKPLKERRKFELFIYRLYGI